MGYKQICSTITMPNWCNMSNSILLLSIYRKPPPISLKNDGSFLEQFKRMQQQQQVASSTAAGMFVNSISCYMLQYVN